jgi:hypothetical protein
MIASDRPGLKPAEIDQQRHREVGDDQRDRNIQVATETLSMAASAGTNFKPLSRNVLALSDRGRPQALVTVGPKPTTLTIDASVAEIAGACRPIKSRAVSLMPA